MDEDGDDEIIDEIPVYLSKTLTENLFVFQYPMKPINTDFEQTSVVNCCVKPLSKQVKVDFALDTASKNYDAFKGEQLALAADGKHPTKTDRPTFKSGTMDKQSYISALPTDNVDKYVIGIIQDHEFHLTKINGIIQMRPNYNYFDKLDKRNKAEQKAENEADLDEEEIKQVTVKFSRIENEKIRKAREKSFNFVSQRGSDEPWCETLWHPKTSTVSELEKQKLFCTNNERTGHALSLNSKEYFDNLLVSEDKVLSADQVIQRAVISREVLKNMSILDQLKVMLRDAKMMNFQQILELFDDKSITSEKILRSLPLAGLLICGNWVVQSEFLYPSETVSSINGVTAELMCRGRDFILCKLSKGENIDRRRIANIIQLPPEEVLEILKTVACLNPTNRRWELLLPPDKQFEQKYQELVQRQEVYWNAKEEKFLELELEKSPKRVRKKSVRENKC